MCHRYSIEALDKILQDIMHNGNPFGGKVIVFGGDFRQILPVVPIRLIHDRWIDKYTERHAAALADLKTELEGTA